MRDSDQAFLTNDVRPEYELGPDPIRAVDLFCGCGGLTVGLAEATRRAGRGIDVVLGLDIDVRATEVFAANFPKAATSNVLVEERLDGKVGHAIRASERAWRDELGPIDVVLGGPPCQGHSNLNNHSRRSDPRNASYLRMARAAEVLRPDVVIAENVPGVVHDRSDVTVTTERVLRLAGYSVTSTVVRAESFGVAQLRRRHVLLAVREDKRVTAEDVMMRVIHHSGPHRDVRWAIGDLLALESSTSFDSPSSASPENRQRMAWLHEAPDRFDLPNRLRPPCHQDGAHSYKSVYGRLCWDAPAQTITTGFTSMGQGRYVHPSRERTLTPHEAARLQFFPDWFTFGEQKRTVVTRLIGNAVPPAVTIVLGKALFDAGVL